MDMGRASKVLQMSGGMFLNRRNYNDKAGELKTTVTLCLQALHSWNKHLDSLLFE